VCFEWLKILQQLLTGPAQFRLDKYISGTAGSCDMDGGKS
jgi:hypothetical protein